MSVYGPRLTNYKFALITIFFISCYQLRHTSSSDFVPPVNNVDEVTTYKYCSGEGLVITKGVVKGNLKFRFSTSQNMSFIEFKDFLGRIVMEMQLRENELSAYDVLRKKAYSHEQLVSMMPILEVFSASDMRNSLWGIAPELPDTVIQKYLSNMHMESKQTDQGILLNKIDATSKFNDQHMIIQFLVREFDIVYPEMDNRIVNNG